MLGALAEIRGMVHPDLLGRVEGFDVLSKVGERERLASVKLVY